MLPLLFAFFDIVAEESENIAADLSRLSDLFWIH